MNPAYILLAIPFFLLGIAIELAVGRLQRKNIYRFNDAIVNLAIGVGNQAFALFIKGLLFMAYIFITENFAFFQQPTTWWSFALALVVFDFIYYWAHRWSHEINFWWAAHVVHHSSEEFNLTVALRQSWFHTALAFVLFLPAALLGFEPVIFFAAAAFHTLYQFWIHTETIGKLWKPVEWLINTPSHHRVHHGRDPKYIDKNHAGVFMLWDRLFGTFQEEEEKPVYGITTPLNSWNPVWANLHYYAEIGAKMKRAKRWKDKLRFIIARPGWSPQEMGGYQPPPPVDSRTAVKYNASASLWQNLYVGLQFALILAGLSALMIRFPELPVFYRVLFFTILIVSTMICGAIFEKKRWVVLAEYVRLLLIVISLNSFYFLEARDWFVWVAVSSALIFALCVFWFTRFITRPLLT